MSIQRILATVTICGAVLLAPSSFGAQSSAQGPLARARTIKCTFPIMAVGTWGKDKPEVQVKPASPILVMEFEGIKADEGTAELKSVYGGKYDIIVRYANGYLHFIQSFLDGPLHVTTIVEKQTAGGKFKAMHSRHEYNDVAITGFPSSPEQYTGECEVVN